MPLAGRDVKAIVILRRTEDISIHAPLAGRDGRCTGAAGRAAHFNPRAPRGARPVFSFSVYPRRGFQSTRPARGATGYPTTTWLLYYRLFQSTRPARGATKPVFSLFEMRTISIHAPREGRDLRTEPPYLVSLISIHAPREGRDTRQGAQSGKAISISIHAPREGRDEPYRLARMANKVFQSTRPARGATSYCFRRDLCRSISIHAPREGRDENPFTLTSI